MEAMPNILLKLLSFILIIHNLFIALLFIKIIMSHEEFIKYPVGNIPKGSFCDKCKRYNSRYVACDTIAVKDNKILLVLRAQNPDKGKWSLPGGYLMWNETVEEGAAREFNEETGYDIKKIEFFKIYSNPNRDDGRQNIVICFIAIVKNQVSKHDDEITKVEWFSLDNLPENMAFDHIKMIEDFTKIQKN